MSLKTEIQSLNKQTNYIKNVAKEIREMSLTDNKIEIKELPQDKKAKTVKQCLAEKSWRNECYVVKHIPLEAYITVNDVITYNIENARAFGLAEAKEYCRDLNCYEVVKYSTYPDSEPDSEDETNPLHSEWEASENQDLMRNLIK